jgi:hypothetical protein
VLSFNMKDLLVSQVDRLILKKSAISKLDRKAIILINLLMEIHLSMYVTSDKLSANQFV